MIRASVLWLLSITTLFPLITFSTGCGGAASGGRVLAFTTNTFDAGGVHPNSVGLADFNRDGHLDIAVSNVDSDTISVFLNKGDGTFRSPTEISLNLGGAHLGAIAVGDFNEDGIPDLVVGTTAGSEGTFVLLGRGDGAFTQLAPIPNSFGFLCAVVRDLNGDGHQDLVLGGNGGNAVAMGRGDGSFTPAITLPAASNGGAYFGIAVADLNGDGIPDIVAADVFGGELLFYAGSKNGTFQSPTEVPIATYATSLSASDFGGDGKTDLLLGYSPKYVNGNATLVRGKGDGTFDFGSSAIKWSDAGSWAIAADVDGDRHTDVVLADYWSGLVLLALNKGNANFVQKFTFSLSPGLSSIAVGDLNGDGIKDIVLTNASTNKVTVVLSTKQ